MSRQHGRPTPPLPVFISTIFRVPVSVPLWCVVQFRILFSVHDGIPDRMSAVDRDRAHMCGRRRRRRGRGRTRQHVNARAKVSGRYFARLPGPAANGLNYDVVHLMPECVLTNSGCRTARGCRAPRPCQEDHQKLALILDESLCIRSVAVAAVKCLTIPSSAETLSNTLSKSFRLMRPLQARARLCVCVACVRACVRA